MLTYKLNYNKKGVEVGWAHEYPPEYLQNENIQVNNCHT